MNKKPKNDSIVDLFKNSNVKDLDDFNKVLQDIAKQGIEALLAGELTEHLGYEKHDYKNKNTSNSRNGFSRKDLNSQIGKFSIEIPRDREGEFETKLIKKRQKDISGLDEKVISMYAKGMSTRDIQTYISEIYSYQLSPESVSNITDKVLPELKEWQERPLEPVYPIVFMDATFVKVRREGRVKNIACYAILGIRLDGKKECLGLWISESESASFWLNVMNNLKNRGVKDILIFAVDGLKGLPEAINTAFPQSEVQKCIVHQIRNSCKYVPWKDRKAVIKDLKSIYQAPSEEAAEQALHDFADKWDKKYAYISKSWFDNWADLSTFFKFPEEIRRLIYTTNPIESFNRSLKKATKNRTVFPNETALLKLLFLVVREVSSKWSNPIRNWSTIFSQLMIYYEDRIKPYF